MDVYRTEEEQLAAIQGWWRENYKIILAAIVLAVASFGGWKWYQHYRTEQAIAAAGLYQGMMKSLQELTAGGAEAKDAAERMSRAGDTLLAEYGNSVYAQYAALMLAGNAVEIDDYARAEKYLRSALAIDTDKGSKVVIENRLARALSAQGKHDEALALLAGDVPEKLVAGREDVRGDILLAKADRAGARKAWQKALDATKEGDGSRSFLMMKLDYVAGE